MNVWFDIAGWFGTATYLLAYLGLSMGWLPPSRRYLTLNLLGACAFMVNSAYHEAWPSVAVNGAWVVISVAALFRLLLRKEPPLRDYSNDDGDSARGIPSGEGARRRVP